MMAPLKNTLQVVNGDAYTFSVAETTAAGFGDLSHASAQPRRAAFLCVSPLRASFNGRALVGRPSGLPGACVTGSPTLPCARPPRLATGSGLTAHTRGRTMRHIYARPEQTQSPIELANSALRAAALAPTVFDALDICADALLVLAALTQPLEARHAE